MRALIVDDTELNIKVASMLLKRLELEVDAVTSGKECLEKIKTNKYEVIFLDIMMPDMDGIETLKELKKMDGFNTPVVALTADAVTGAKEKYLGLGFTAYIPKPIDMELLKSTLQTITDGGI